MDFRAQQLVNYSPHNWTSERQIFMTIIFHPLCPIDLFLYTNLMNSYSIVSMDLFFRGKKEEGG